MYLDEEMGRAKIRGEGQNAEDCLWTVYGLGNEEPEAMARELSLM